MSRRVEKLPDCRPFGFGASVLQDASLGARRLLLTAFRGLELRSHAGSRPISSHGLVPLSTRSAALRRERYKQHRSQEQSAALRESLLVVAHGSNNRHTARLA